MADVELLLRQYGSDLDEQCPPVSLVELERRLELIATDDRSTVGDRVSDSEAVDIRVVPADAVGRSTRRWRIAVVGAGAAAAAAAVLVVMLVLWQGDGADDGQIFTDTEEPEPTDDNEGPDPEPSVQPSEDETPTDADPDAVVPFDDTGPIEWSRLDITTPQQLLGDGSGYFALVDDGNETELLSSDDGSTWRSLGPVTFDRINWADDGTAMAVSATVNEAVVHTIDADGTIIESRTPAPVADHLLPYVSEVDATIFRSPDGFVVAGSYHVDCLRLLAAGLGLSAEDLLDLPEGPVDESVLSDFVVLRPEHRAPPCEGSFGVTSVEYDVEIDGEPVVVEYADLGLTSPEVWGNGNGFLLHSSDGVTWESLGTIDPFPDGDVVAIDGGVAGNIGIQSLVAPRGLSVSVDGTEWIGREDESGEYLSQGIVLPWRDAAVYRSAFADDPELWLVDLDGAVRLETTGTDLNRDQPAEIATGDAGIAYFAGFTVQLDGWPNPTELVFSRDGLTWERTALPEFADDDGRFRGSIAVGADDFVVVIDDHVWHGVIR